MAKLDRSKPYNVIYGASEAKFFQSGKYFTGLGEEISAERAAQPYGLTDHQLREIEQENAAVDEVVKDDAQKPEDPDPPAETAATGEVPEVTETPESDEKVDDGYEERFNEAMKLHARTLKDMCAEHYRDLKENGKADGIPSAPYTGPGSKIKNAEWLATYAV